MIYYYQDDINVRTNSVTTVNGCGVGYNASGEPTFLEGSNAPIEPVTLTEFKEQFGKVDVPDEDTFIETVLIPGARRLCEAYTNKSFISRGIIVPINNANGGFFLPYGPVTSIPTAVDKDGNDLTVRYEFKKLEAPLGQSTVSYIGGYDVLPNDLKLGLLNAIYYLYENRSIGVDNIGEIAKTILKPFRRV